MPAFGATSCEHGPTVLTLHACTEPVRLGPFAVVGLKCTFWHVLCRNESAHSGGMTLLEMESRRIGLTFSIHDGCGVPAVVFGRPARRWSGRCAGSPNHSENLTARDHYDSMRMRGGAVW